SLDEWLKLLQSADAKDRRNATRVLAKGIGPEGKAAAPALIRALRDEDSGVRCDAATALGKVGPVTKEVVPALAAALADKEVRSSAADALGEIGPTAREAIPALGRAYEESVGTWTVGNIICALGRMGEAGAPLLANIYQKGGPITRAIACETLGRMGPAARAAVLTLAEGLPKEEDPWHRSKVTSALRKIGPRANEAVPAHLRAEQDPPRVVR